MTLGAVAILVMASCVDKKNTNATGTAAPAAASPEAMSAGSKIAYVNLDTLEEKYEYFKTKKAEFEKKTAGMESEVERLAQSFQKEYIAFQKKAQSGSLTQSEGEAAQKKLEAMQQNIESRRQNLQMQLMKEQESFNKELQKRLDDYLAKYNEDKQYDFILSYVKGGSILFANKALDITSAVIEGMNAEDKSQPAKPADTK